MAVALLVLAVVGIYVRPRRVPFWAAPTIAALLVLVLGDLSLAAARNALAHLGPALAFLIAAVPLASLLDRLGFFAALAARADRARNIRWWLWCLAAAVTLVFNLDAAVVLLTPLYVRIARRHGIDPLELAIQPVLLAHLASSALPVANLTNLIVVARTHATTESFLVRLGPATVAAVGAGWVAYVVWLRRRRPVVVPKEDVILAGASETHAIRRGAPVVGLVLVGFVLGPFADIPAWSVALVADVILLFMVRPDIRVRVPWSAALTVCGLGLTATAAARSLQLDRWLLAGGPGGDVRALLATAVGANAINNLPAVLVALPTALMRTDRVWVVLFAANVGSTLFLTGSLAALLWRDAAHAVGVDVTPRQYSMIGLRIGAPAFLFGSAVLLVTQALLR